MLRAVKARYKHLREPEIPGPGDSVFLILAKLVDPKMRTDATETGIVDDLLEFCGLEFCEAPEAVVAIAHRRAQLDALKASVRELFERTREILCDHFPNRPCLTSNGKSQWVRL